MFKSLPVVYDVRRLEAGPLSADYRVDTMTLGWEDRLKTRARRRSDGGCEFATSLARGTVLREGDALVLETLRLVVRVVEQQEAVFVITPETPCEWALFAYHIGNGHQPIMLIDDGIVCLDVMGMAQLLEYHAIPYERSRRAFTPVGQIPAHQHGVSR
jgi:urease accessory protein